VLNQRPARGRPRKVLDRPVYCSVCEKFVVMHSYINTTQMCKKCFIRLLFTCFFVIFYCLLRVWLSVLVQLTAWKALSKTLHWCQRVVNILCFFTQLIKLCSVSQSDSGLLRVPISQINKLVMYFLHWYVTYCRAAFQNVVIPIVCSGVPLVT